MAKRFFHIRITTGVERNDALTRVRQTIGARGGWIVSHSLFSNLAATINFELPTAEAAALVRDLKGAGLNAQVEGGMPSDSQGDTRATVALTFIHQDPDLKRPVPAFG